MSEVTTPKPTHILAISVGMGDWPVSIGVVDIKDSKAEVYYSFLGRKWRQKITDESMSGTYIAAHEEDLAAPKSHGNSTAICRQR